MSDTTTDSTTVPPRRKGVRRALWTAGTLLALSAVGYLATPPVARHYAQKYLGEILGREVSIERVLINPFRLTAEVGGLRVMAADGSGEALSFDALRANLEIESVVRKGIVLHELALEAPRVKLALEEGGRHNWSDVVERIKALGGDAPAEESAPLQFSVGNIRISGGQIEVEDKPRGLRHELSEIGLGVPFVSNLPVKVDVFVQPSLSAKLNGDPLLLNARTKPFAETHETILDVALKQFDLAPWVAYLPIEPRFKLPSALLTTNLELSFSQPADAPPVVALRGPLQIDQLELQDRAGAPVAKVAELELEFADVQPLIGRWHFTRLRLAKPEVDLVMLKDGGLNLMDLLLPPDKAAAAKAPAKPAPAAAAPKTGGAATEPEAPAAGTEAAAAAAPASSSAQPDFLLALARIRDGVIRLEDRTLAEPFRARIEAINLDMRDLANVGELPAEIRLDYVSDAGEKFVHEDVLRLSPFQFSGNLQFEAIKLARYAPYLSQALPGGAISDGALTGALQYRVTLGDKGEPKIELNAEALALRDFALMLKGAKAPAIKVPALDLRSATVDIAGRNVRVGGLDLRGAEVSAVRLKDGSFDLVKALVPSPTPAAKGARGAKAAKEGGDWVIAVDKLALKAASVRLEDRGVRRPVVTTVDNIDFELDGFSTAKGAPLQFKLDSRFNKRGKIAATGPLTLEPLKADLRLDLRNVDLLPLQPYVLEQTKIAISRGNVTTQGRLNLQTGRRGQVLARFNGDVGVANFASVDRLNATDFLRWRTLRVGGIDARLEPFALAIKRVALDDFYTRLILDDQGRLNLREIGGLSGEEPPAPPPKAAAPVALGGEASPMGEPAPAAEGKRTVEVAPPTTPPPPIRIDRVEIKRGNVAFSDRFIRPNYDANLTDLAGTLTGFSTSPDTIAKLDLVGKVDKAAPLSIVGEFNPFRQDAHLDIVAKVTDFELTGLSSYSGKYVGYGIAKGKLSAELNYKIEDRKLTATNQIFLDQLTFGDKVDSPDAVNLPVQLAVSLLKNRRGEIDLHLPVSGTLDDPEFSIFGLVLKMFFNLIGKAITSPFALLGSALGGSGEELSQLELAAGSARPGEAQQGKLKTLAEALIDRPTLKLDITGRADPATDLDGLRQAALDNAVRAQKLKAMIARGEDAPSLEEIEVGAEEYPALLEKAYKAADFKKPRNLIGLAKDIPGPEMEALMRANVKVGDAELRALAQQRAQAVREWLAGEGGVPGERIFVLEPKVEALGEGGQVQFSLR
ncbi:hypothetical protein CKCBHOJB_01582 [Thauera sp. GDN1]|uniref:DUF748 domain-containing protein n=1 Tax=Thauera sp. GDN1 TaxID=2944810 RepID=UPI00247937F2|nr:DUF748 domain-containing protein [Thauera sp. GDN1]WEN41997.1 hypothetical protein CKCBHOJB_01582 [Thauera sp. GDN1]